MSSIVKINERSWGIDLISHINEYLVGKDIIIKRAGGEHSLKAERNTMFPDVLLFGDSQLMMRNLSKMHIKKQNY